MTDEQRNALYDAITGIADDETIGIADEHERRDAFVAALRKHGGAAIAKLDDDDDRKWLSDRVWIGVAQAERWYQE